MALLGMVHLVVHRDGLALRAAAPPSPPPAPPEVSPAQECWGALLAAADAQRACEPFVRGKRFRAGARWNRRNLGSRCPSWS